MTITEAEAGAAERHEFRWFEYERQARVTVTGIRAVCHCGWVSATHGFHESARNAHTRHQEAKR